MPAISASNYKRVTHSIYRDLCVTVEIRSDVARDDDHSQRMKCERMPKKKKSGNESCRLVKAIWNLEK